LNIYDPEYILPIALTVHQQMVKRIFDDGKDASDAQIGEYTEGYVRTRERAGLGGDRKVILQFTGQMRNDFSVIQNNRKLGHGFKNTANFDKSEWVEETYEKEIFDFTDDEKKLFSDLLNEKLDATFDK